MNTQYTPSPFVDHMRNQPQQEEEPLPWDVLKSLISPPLPWKVFFFSDPTVTTGKRLYRLPQLPKYIDRLEHNIKRFHCNYFLICSLFSLIGMLERPILLLYLPIIIFLWYKLFLTRKAGNSIPINLLVVQFQIPSVLVLILFGIITGIIFWSNDNYYTRYVYGSIGVLVCWIHASLRVTGNANEYDIMTAPNRTFSDVTNTVKEITRETISDIQGLYRRRKGTQQAY